VIELRDDLGVAGVIPLTDDDIPSPGRWRGVAKSVQERGDVVYIRDISKRLGVRQPYASRLLAQAILSSKVRNLGHQKGWTAAEQAAFQLFALCTPLERPITWASRRSAVRGGLTLRCGKARRNSASPKGQDPEAPAVIVFTSTGGTSRRDVASSERHLP
jgi:hypothetical protein